jgi:hypothetical protein
MQLFAYRETIRRERERERERDRERERLTVPGANGEEGEGEWDAARSERAACIAWRESRVQETGRKEVPTRSGPRSRRLFGLEPAQC